MSTRKYEHRTVTIMSMGDRYYVKPAKDVSQSTLIDFNQLGEDGWRVVYVREAGNKEFFLLLEREKP